MAKVAFTVGRVAKFKCPPTKKQDFIWDSVARGLGLRATPAGKSAYVFQGVYQGKDVRITIGSPNAWSIPDAQAKARELYRLIDEGKDPRGLKRDAVLQAEAQRQHEHAQTQAAIQEAMTAQEVWNVYLEERRPHWGKTHYLNHLEKASPGGVPSKRRGMTDKLTTSGPLATLLPLPLISLDSQTIEAWAAKEGKVRPSSARLSMRLLSVFFNWCAEHPQYSEVVSNRNPTKSKKARESLGRQNLSTSALQREQLPAWFAAVSQIQNPIISTALQVMLLTGARPNEVLDLHWDDINWQWKGMQLRDKVDGDREIPLTPYVASLISKLPKRNSWVFSSTRTLAMDQHNIHRRKNKAAKRSNEAPVGDVQKTSATGRISSPNTPHSRACRNAGIEDMTLQGLRRSFSSLTEWLEIPAGIVAQIQGHKPSATAEKHYKRRPLDLLRLHHERIEAWMLEQAGINPNTASKSISLRTQHIQNYSVERAVVA
jgi:integrase